MRCSFLLASTVMTTIAVACGSSGAPRLAKTSLPPPVALPRECPADVPSGACGRDFTPCDYEETRCFCTGSQDGCPGGVPRPPPAPDEVRYWACGPRPHPICDTRSGFEGACDVEGVTCSYCYSSYTCSEGQWSAKHEPIPT